MKAKLTKKFVDGVTAEAGKRVTIWDTELPAFGLMVTPDGPRGGGVKSYIVQYRCGGRGAPIRRVTIGHHGPEWQPGAAREEASEILRQVRRGGDPFEDRRRAREEQRLVLRGRLDEMSKNINLVFATFRDTFIEDYAKVRQKRSWSKTERALKDAGVSLDSQRIDQIQREAIKWAIERIAGRSMSSAIEAHKALGRMFRWAVSEGQIDKSPMIDMEPPGKNNVRKRVLRGDELRELWNAALDLGYPFGPLILLLIATGQRLRQVSNATWGEIHKKERVWLIPEERVKADANHEREHLIPLNARAMAIIGGLPDIAPPEGTKLAKPARPLFTTTGAGPVSGFSKAKTRLDALMLAARQKAAEEQGVASGDVDPIDAWTNHDIRRTLSTTLQALQVASNIIDLIQAHVVKGMTRVARHYQHWEFYEEKRDALDLWSRYLDGVIDNDPAQADLVARVNFRLLHSTDNETEREGLAEDEEDD